MDPPIGPSTFALSGVIPGAAISADLGPPRTELGIGGLMPWQERLYVLTYVSHTRRTGAGAGLYYMDPGFQMHRCAEAVDGTCANRFVHFDSNQLIIGPHVIDPEHRIRTIEPLIDVRLCGTMTHLEDPANKVYMLGMEGEFFELDVHTLSVRKRFDLVHELGIRDRQTAHFKAGYTYGGRVCVANNSYFESDHLGESPDGRLAEWDGNTWRVIERAPFVEVTGRGGFSGTIFASGWDRASVLLSVFHQPSETWTRYRLPKASHCFEHAWQTEWPRIREIEHERFLMDIHGMFYELSPWAYGGRVWGVKPISQHLWVHGDFCSWRGLTVLGADNASAHGRDNILCAQPQSGLWFGKTDDLWSFGKPRGWGGPWWETEVCAGMPSDPYLMTGFEHKCLHLSHRSDQPVRFELEVDITGDGNWNVYREALVGPHGYDWHVFPTGFSVHWVRLCADTACTATAQLHYT